MSKTMGNAGRNMALRAIAFAILPLAALCANPAAARAERAPAEPAAVIETYVEIAHAGFEDAHLTAQALNRAVLKLTGQPTETNLSLARKAWKAARIPYLQTETFRFGNAIVDEWEGRVNSWPLDEGLIDYVSTGYGADPDENELAAANVIANRTLKLSGALIDISTITGKLLSETLHEAGGVEANVATGYHAIEFLLWGQDLNGTGPGAGSRPASDFDPKNCTGGNCGRRVQYLRTVTELLVNDLAWMARQWAPGGAARKKLQDGNPATALTAMLTGMGSLSYGELAGERIKLGLLLHDPEEEHDCFSDNTHNSHYYDVLGIENVYLGRYRRIDGSEVKGPALSDLVRANDPAVDKALKAELAATLAAMSAIVKRAEAGEAYDQMLAEGNETGNALLQNALTALLKQTRGIERAVAALKLKSIRLQGSDSLDRP